MMKFIEEAPALQVYAKYAQERSDCGEELADVKEAMDVPYRREDDEDVRDHINELGELATRASDAKGQDVQIRAGCKYASELWRQEELAKTAQDAQIAQDAELWRQEQAAWKAWED